MKVIVISQKLIKPCTPTPPNLNKYKLSFTDELTPPMNVGYILFYPSNPKQITVSHLEASLAKTLVQFYPLAGRHIKNDRLIDCSDEGAEFIQAEAVDVELIDLVAKHEAEQLKELLPSRFYNQVDEAATNPLLSIQITELKSGGGLAIGISVSHRILDALSIVLFISAWSSANHPEGEVTITPSFDTPSLLRNQGRSLNFGPSGPARNPNLVAKKYSFNKEAIAKLRSKLRPNHEDGSVRISRVRVVCALIAKALIGVDRAKHGRSRACLIFQPVSMRERTIPPLPKHSCGNLAIESATRCISATETEDIGIQDLVDIIGDATKKTIADCEKIMASGEDAYNTIIYPMKKWFKHAGEVNILLFSDCSKFGIYDSDFGWGKPVWVGIGSMPTENATILMDNKEGDGIEAWVHLLRSDMSAFGQDQDIKLFTT